VTFYENPASLCRIVADFLGAGLRAGQPALVIGTPAHRAGILTELALRQFDPAQLQAAGDLLMLDAGERLAMFMTDGMPDALRFTSAAEHALDRLCRGCKDRTIRAYGEMVDVLWKQGQDAAAIRLEMLWNKLAATRDFSLLCGYAMGNFYKDAGRAAIHHQHTHVLAADDDGAPALA
jgi:hypothetical protein